MFEFYDLSDDERATYLTRVRSATFVKRVNNRIDAAIFNKKINPSHNGRKFF